MISSFLKSFPVILLIALVSCQPNSGKMSTSTNTANIDSLFEAYSAFKQRISPVEATKLGVDTYNDTIANYLSKGYQQDLIENYRHFSKAVESIDLSDFEQTERLSLEVMKWDCDIKLEGLTNDLVTVSSPVWDMPNFDLIPLDHTWSFHLYFSQLASGAAVQPFRSVKDYENWLNRVGDYVPWLDTAIVKMQEGARKGIVWPKVIVERMIGQVDGLINDRVEEHVYYLPVRNMPDVISGEDQDRLAYAFSEMITKEVNPAHRKLKKFLEEEYLPNAGVHTGIGALPNGKETYQYLIRLHTTTNMTPDEIFELGKSEVIRIGKEMEKLMAEIGFEGPLREFLEHVRNRKALMPYTTADEVIAHFNDIHDTIKPYIPRLFDQQPKAGFEVKRTEAFREASTGAHYIPGPKDASRPGVFYISVPDAANYNIFSDEALFLHEAIPGHHYQLSMQQENEKLPEFLHPESMGVFVEGWALYTESLGEELGLYKDPYQRFGALNMEMHRAIRLVVDAGMHAKGWTREQAIRYSLENEADSEENIISEIERYMTMPGQALSYKIGQLKITQLREKAERTLGDAFDIREFHNQVLNTGSLPLVLLEQKIDHWIKSQI